VLKTRRREACRFDSGRAHQFARVGEMAYPPGRGPGAWRFDSARAHQFGDMADRQRRLTVDQSPFGGCGGSSPPVATTMRA
jgi:hypothetical protein